MGILPRGKHSQTARLLILVVLAGLAWLAAACAPSDNSPDESSLPAQVEDGADQSDHEATETQTLVDRIGIDFNDESAVLMWFDTAEIEWRRLTAECMLDEGFEYSQEDWSSPGALPTIGRGTSREYAEQYGFGVVPAFLAAIYDPTASYEAPNSAYIETLTPPERDAYFVALVGNPEGENSGENGLPDAGCAGEASATSFALVNQFGQLVPLFEDYAVRMEADPLMIAINEQWDNCMAEAGFGGVAQDQLYENFSNRLIAIFSSGDAFAYSPSDIPDLPQPDLPMNGPSWRVLPELNERGQSKVDALLIEEIATATASFDCRQATMEAQEEIEAEYEAEFLIEFDSQIEDAFSS